MSEIGPQLPPHFHKKEEKDTEKHEESVSINYGPILPPGFQNGSKSKNSIGPDLPGSSRKTGDNYDSNDTEEIIGPCLPAQIETGSEKDRIRREFEARADAMKNKLTGKAGEGEKLEREDWMLQLPPGMSKNFGLGPRTFRSKAAELGDRSVWTDTPADKEKKLRQRREDSRAGEKRKAEVRVPTAEEGEMHARVEEYNKATRPKSLLEMHKEKQEKTEQPTGRRPFDRERDLNVHRANPKEKAKFIEQAKGLSSKFSLSSYENKFL